MAEAPVSEPEDRQLIATAFGMLDHDEQSKVLLRDRGFQERMLAQLKDKEGLGLESKTPERLVAFIREGLRRAAGYSPRTRRKKMTT